MTKNEINQMKTEYDKGGKFKDFVDKSCKAYRTSVLEELQKVIVQEYFKSVTEGCNKETRG